MAQYAGTATSTAGASASQLVYPFDRIGHYPSDQSLSAPQSNTEASGSTLLGANAGGASAFSSASFMATAGGLHLAAITSTGASPSAGWDAGASSSSYADAVAYDSFVVNAPSYASGAVFTITASVNLTGSVGAMGSVSPAGASGNFDALSSWRAEVQLYNSTMQFPLQAAGSSACWDNPSVGMGCSGGPAALSLTFTVSNGQPTDLVILGQARARSFAGAGAGAVAAADAWSDLGHTIAWGGIDSVRDSEGKLIAAYTALSATSGFEYRNGYVSAVPEPRSWLLFVVGILGIAYAGRHGAIVSRIPRKPV